jgi:ubiquinone/menaquinone biosynthesis C-methylase UbiE
LDIKACPWSVSSSLGRREGDKTYANQPRSNFHAPVTEQLEQGIVVLDSGCGPATWTLEMGEQYPKSKFHGIDISCVFPEHIKPANVKFNVGNIAKDIPFDDNTFDYIHQRLLLGGLTNDDWESVSCYLCNT